MTLTFKGVKKYGKQFPRILHLVDGEGNGFKCTMMDATMHHRGTVTRLAPRLLGKSELVIDSGLRGLAVCLKNIAAANDLNSMGNPLVLQ